MPRTLRTGAAPALAAAIVAASSVTSAQLTESLVRPSAEYDGDVYDLDCDPLATADPVDALAALLALRMR